MNWKRWLVVIIGGYFVVRGLWPTVMRSWGAFWVRWGLPWHTIEVVGGCVLVLGALVMGRRRRKLPPGRPPLV